MAYVSGYAYQMLPELGVTVDADQEFSGQINAYGFVLCGIIFPAEMTGTAITFEVSMDDGATFHLLKSTVSGTTLTYDIIEGAYLAINPVDFYGVNCFRIVSNDDEADDRDLVIALRGI